MEIKKMLAGSLVALAAVGASAYQVSVGTFVSNAGRTVTVPVALDSAAGLSYASAQITYDPQVLVVTKAVAGSLKSVLDEDFVATDGDGKLVVSIFGSTATNVVSGVGTIAEVTFAVREGTEGLYSDLAVTDVQLGEKTGVKDVTVGNPVTTVNGMVRVMGTSAAVARLENAQTVCAETRLGTLVLAAGDALQASDGQVQPIVVSGTVTAGGTIPVKAPVNGWASGRYALLSTPTSGLALTLEGTEGAVVAETANGLTTYYATVAIAGEVDVVCTGETLTAGDKNQIRRNVEQLFAGKTDAASLALKTRYGQAKKLVVSGPVGSVAVIADMGIAPACAAALDATGTLNLTYVLPDLRITSFNPKTGAVRIKVTPGTGNAIVSELATGYVHVYGTSRLKDPMRFISQVGFDLTPYLKPETKGEAILNIALGTHSFLKVKVENTAKNDGDVE